MTATVHAFVSSNPELESVGTRFSDPLPPKAPELITGILPAEGVTLISGPTNIGKSLVALEICSAVSTKRPLWGSLTPTKRIDRLVYLLGEHTASVIIRLFNHTGLPMTQDAWVVGPEKLGADKHVVARGEVVSETLEHYQRLVEGAGLIVVDPLAAFIAGANAENDNAAMRHLVDAFSLLGETNEAPVLILGHFGKPTQNPDGSQQHRTTYASRGASGAEDACPTVHYLEAEEGQTFRFRTRKYKGDVEADKLLFRNEATKVHTLLTSNRPTVEARQIAFKEKVDRAMTAGIAKTHVVKVVAALEDVNVRTAWRWCKEKGENQEAE